MQPTDGVHKNLMAACVEQYHDLIKARWLVIEGVRGSISTPFYWVLVFWLGRPVCELWLESPAELDEPHRYRLYARYRSPPPCSSSSTWIGHTKACSAFPSAAMRNALADMMR